MDAFRSCRSLHMSCFFGCLVGESLPVSDSPGTTVILSCRYREWTCLQSCFGKDPVSFNTFTSAVAECQDERLVLNSQVLSLSGDWLLTNLLTLGLPRSALEGSHNGLALESSAGRFCP